MTIIDDHRVLVFIFFRQKIKYLYKTISHFGLFPSLDLGKTPRKDPRNPRNTRKKPRNSRKKTLETPGKEPKKLENTDFLVPHMFPRSFWPVLWRFCRYDTLRKAIDAPEDADLSHLSVPWLEDGEAGFSIGFLGVWVSFLVFFFFFSMVFSRIL